MTRKQICIKANHAKCKMVKATFHQRFWARVNKNGPIPRHCPQLGPCWLWEDASKRYGEVKKEGKKYLVHRLIFEMTRGPIPKGQHVCHHCDVMKCVNPDHLFCGSALDNILDSVKKGRWGKAKLKPKDVVLLRELQVTQSKEILAEKFGISVPSVQRAIHRRTWACIS